MIQIKLGSNGRLGNKMFQYMYCRHLQMLLPESRIENLQMPEFNLLSENSSLPGRVLEILDGHKHCMNSISYKLKRGIYDSLFFSGCVQRLEYYPSRDFCSGLFTSNCVIDSTLIDTGNLLINVRGAEILQSLHGDYGPVPVDFYSQVAEKTKLTPVIMGQIGDDFYSDEIRKRFAGCHFVPSKSALEDFQLMRNAKNICLSVSTFAWLAAWLSTTAQNIHMPISGLYNPKQRPDIDLLPAYDERYIFYEFPVERWQASERQRIDLVAQGKQFRMLSQSETMALIS
jgi:hypothetical protein